VTVHIEKFTASHKIIPFYMLLNQWASTVQLLHKRSSILPGKVDPTSTSQRNIWSCECEVAPVCTCETQGLGTWIS
jgi:hypothetical protein